MLRRIAHVALAVADLDAAVDRWTAVWGLEVVHREIVADQGVEEVLLEAPDGGAAVQLLGALGPDTPVGRFLGRRGEGLHHIAWEVDDLPAVLAALTAAGVELVDRTPRTGTAGTSMAFVHPVGNGGVLTELVERPHP